jgi:hypothetical protein
MDAENPDGKCHGRVTIESNIIDCPEAKYSITLANVTEAVLRSNQLSGTEGQVSCPDQLITDNFPVKF